MGEQKDGVSGCLCVATVCVYLQVFWFCVGGFFCLLLLGFFFPFFFFLVVLFGFVWVLLFVFNLAGSSFWLGRGC